MKFQLALLIIALPLQLIAQPSPATVKASAMNMTKALLNKQQNSVLEYLQPAVIQSAGGPAKAIAMMDSTYVYMAKFGATIKRITIGNPGKIVLENGEWQCIVPQTTQLEMMGNQILLHTFLLAISHQNGQQWYFMDVNLLRDAKNKKGFPQLHPTIVIPKMQAPEIKPISNNP